MGKSKDIPISKFQINTIDVLRRSPMRRWQNLLLTRRWTTAQKC